MAEREKKESEAANPFVETGRYMGYGLNWALSTMLFLLVGWWVDSKIGTSPILLILGAFVGAAAGFYSLYFHIVVAPRKKLEGEDH